MLYCPMIAPQSVVGMTQVAACHELEGKVSQSHSECEGVLARSTGAVMVASQVEIVAHVSRNPSKPTLITQGFCKDFSVLQVIEHSSKFTHGEKRTTQVKAEIDGLLAGLTGLGEMLEG